MQFEVGSWRKWLFTTAICTSMLNPFAFIQAADFDGSGPGRDRDAYLVASTGLIACAMMTDPVLTMTMLVIAAMGQSSTAPCFWSLPTAMLSGTAAAGGIALINALGNLGGFFGPYAFGLIKDATGSFMFGLIAIAAGPIVSATVVLMLGHDRRLERIPDQRRQVGRIAG
jgi:nitrate/nitrite transporter NarK